VKILTSRTVIIPLVKVIKDRIELLKAVNFGSMNELIMTVESSPLMTQASIPLFDSFYRIVSVKAT